MRIYRDWRIQDLQPVRPLAIAKEVEEFRFMESLVKRDIETNQVKLTALKTLSVNKSPLNFGVVAKISEGMTSVAGVFKTPTKQVTLPLDFKKISVAAVKPEKVTLPLDFKTSSELAVKPKELNLIDKFFIWINSLFRG